MTIEQLLCPAVITWERDFRKKLNESHIEMTNDEIADEFDKWLIENEDLVNKSVEDNIDHIHEVMRRAEERTRSLNEGMFNKGEFDDDEEEGEDKEEDEPLSGEVDNEEENEEESSVNSLTGAIRLDGRKDSKDNIFTFINEFYSMVEEEKSFDQTHKGLMRKLDVSGVKDMTALFAFTNLPNLDLSSWNTGNVKKMEGMFYKSTFNNESICDWDVTSCTDFKNMFLFCPFNKSLSKWTPGFVQVTVTNPDGKREQKMVRQDLPILGGTEDENKAKNKLYARDVLKRLSAEDESNESKNTNNNNTMKHIIDYDTFINEGKFRDFIDKGVEKVKGFFKAVTLKVGDLLAFFKEDGEMYPVTSPYTSLALAASGQIPGVTAFCDVDNEYLTDVPKEAEIVPEPGYYGIIDKDSVEYENYQTFKSMINEHYEKYGNTGLFHLNEDFKRVGFSAEEGGVVAPDITTEDLKEILNDVVEHTPFNKGKDYDGATLIWGAPGIGKSTIPKAVIKAWNKKKGDEFHKKAVMVVECGDLTIDGFSLPIPVEKSIGDYLDERPTLKDQISKKGVATDTLERIKKNFHKVSVEAPKTWLPAFKLDATPEEVKVLNDIANGYLDIKFDDNGEVIKTETTEGGILLFDEFFRSNPNIFKILMQLILNRSYSGYMLGNKWGILCCSNRPEDDEEVKNGFEKSGPVLGNRLLAGSYNFIPSFDEWKKWAVKEGYFDNYTIEFLMMEKNAKGEYTNWHTIKPEEYIAKGKTIWPTPRSWSGLMSKIHNYMVDNNLSSITDVVDNSDRWLLRTASGIIGEETATKYVSYIKTMSKNYKAVDVQSLLEDPDFQIPDDIKCGEVTRQVENYIKTIYSPDELPNVGLLMNMFNTIDKKYTTAKDNFTKIMHINIIKFFKINSPKAPNYEPLKDYVNAVDERYNLTPADLK